MLEEYWVAVALPDAPWMQVTQEDYVRLERAAGFRPKPGHGPVATSAFSGGGVRGQTWRPEVRPPKIHRVDDETKLLEVDAAPGDRGFTVYNQQFWVYQGEKGWVPSKSR